MLPKKCPKNVQKMNSPRLRVCPAVRGAGSVNINTGPVFFFSFFLPTPPGHTYDQQLYVDQLGHRRGVGVIF
jgi:hypothetical protein